MVLSTAYQENQKHYSITEISYYYCSVRSNLATLYHGIHSVRIDISSILNQISVISSQKLKPALLNPSNLKLLLTKLENQLVSHPRLALPNGKVKTFGICISS